MLIFAAHPGAAPAQPQPSQLRTTLRQGIEKAFNLEIQSATGLFRKAVELDRENPLGYAFLALTHMFAYEMSFDPKERAREEESMLKDVDEALARGQKRIDKNVRDGRAYFAMALAKIVKIRWAIAQKRLLHDHAGDRGHLGLSGKREGGRSAELRRLFLHGSAPLPPRPSPRHNPLLLLPFHHRGGS